MILLHAMDASAVDSLRWYQVAVPLILLMIMASMGMELRTADFRRVLQLPRAALVGLAGQILLLPGVGLAFALWYDLPPEVALGVVIITACPGGATSNIFSYLARANLALSVTLTALSSVLCFASTPTWIRLGAALVSTDGDNVTDLHLPLGPTLLRLFVVTLLPIGLGMAVRARWPGFAGRARVPLRRTMAALMGVSVLLIIASEHDALVKNFQASATAALLLVSGMLLLSYGLARAAHLGDRDAFTISIEVGLQNGALATMIVVSLIDRPELLVFPGTYAVLALLPVTLWTLAMRRKILPPG